MRICRPWFIVVITLLLMPFGADASDHSSDMSGGVSFDQGSVLTGWFVSLGITPVRNTGEWDRLSVIGDFGVHQGTNDSGDPVTRMSFAIGGRIWATPDPWRNRLYGQATFGGVRNHIAAVATTDVAGSVGFGYEFHLIPNGMNTGGLATRVQLDRLFVNDRDDHTRVSVGVVWRVP